MRPDRAARRLHTSFVDNGCAPQCRGSAEPSCAAPLRPVVAAAHRQRRHTRAAAWHGIAASAWPTVAPRASPSQSCCRAVAHRCRTAPSRSMLRLMLRVVSQHMLQHRLRHADSVESGAHVAAQRRWGRVGPRGHGGGVIAPPRPNRPVFPGRCGRCCSGGGSICCSPCCGACCDPCCADGGVMVAPGVTQPTRQRCARRLAIARRCAICRRVRHVRSGSITTVCYPVGRTSDPRRRSSRPLSPTRKPTGSLTSSDCLSTCSDACRNWDSVCWVPLNSESYRGRR